MTEPLAADQLACEVRRLLAALLPPTVLVVYRDGSMAAAVRGAVGAAPTEWPGRPVAGFVASATPPPHAEVAGRIRDGLPKQGV